MYRGISGDARIGWARVTVVWRRELGVLAVNWTDILDGEIVNAAWALAGMVAKPRTSRRIAADYETAVWANTERLIRDALAEIAADPALAVELSPDDVAELAAAVRGPEVQGALQALLAVRLTDAPELDAARAREAVRLALATRTAAAPGTAARERRRQAAARAAQEQLERDLEEVRQGLVDGFQVPAAPEPARPWYAGPLSEYLDDKISALVAMLEARVGFAGLAQVRAEAYNARIVALLGAIERQVAALADPGSGTRAEAEYLERYRRQARQRHGFLTPPDFDRRRRVPVADIYVATRISEEDDPTRMRLPPDQEPDSLTVWDLAGRLDRTVLLGDPGGGKTTAANVLTDHFAGDGSPRIAFLVTLREYAARTPIEWSVAEHVEHNLAALYQSPAPDGLVERLLLTGRAVVIFDGLDELLDTSRRRDVSDRVEQFCSAYPLTPVLVTSRVVGYDQARLDDSQFSCYRLGGFGDDEVEEYASKWFRTQEGLAPAEAAAKAEAFLAESANATDLRANPLLLSLMCILYRGTGSLPGDRAGIYARCAELLLRKWDEQRELYRKLGSDHLVEPTLRYLAWWLFTREDSQTAATERALVAKAAEFLYERGYETDEQARAAARDFVEFCRGRMWVFSDAGTTADGEKLYGFTHRTFLEYFAAWHLAVTSESPEELARTLAPRISSAGWTVVAELAIRIKSESSDRGADRVYAALLDPALGVSSARHVLEFLAALLPAARPAPTTVRSLARALLGCAPPSEPKVYLTPRPFDSLLAYGGNYRNVVADETSAHIARLVASDDPRDRADGLRLALAIFLLGQRNDGFWQGWAREKFDLYREEITDAAISDNEFRVVAILAEALAPADALVMPGGLDVLATVAVHVNTALPTAAYRSPMYVVGILPPCVLAAAHTLVGAQGGPTEPVSWATAIGRYLLAHPEPPWAIGSAEQHFGTLWDDDDQPQELPDLGHQVNLGTAATLCLAFELKGIKVTDLSLDPGAVAEPGHGGMRAMARYVYARAGAEAGELPDLPVPAEFRQVFRDWAASRVSFFESAAGHESEIA